MSPWLSSSFGWKDIENRIPATVNDYYVLFSQTKAIVSVAFMALVERGLVAVDDPVSKLFPEIPDHVVTEVREYVKEAVLDPLGMDDTDWYYEPSALNRFVKPYRFVDGRLEPASTMHAREPSARSKHIAKAPSA